MSILKLKGNDSGTGNVTLEAPNTNTDQTIAIPDGAGSFVTANASGDVAVTGDLTVDTNTLFVDSTNNRVGIGTTSLSVNAEIRGSGSNGQMRLGGSTAATYASFYSDNDGALVLGADAGNNSTGLSRIGFEVDGTQRMIINHQGQISMGSSSHADDILYLTRSNDGKVQRFFRGASEVGDISVTSSSTSYNTSSDYRLKENVVDLTGASERVNQIPVHRFNFIADPDKTVDGFLAHELQAVVPEAVTGTHNEVDEDGNPVYQGVDQSKVVPLLTAALQEALAKIETLETEMTSVKARLDVLEAV